MLNAEKIDYIVVGVVCVLGGVINHITNNESWALLCSLLMYISVMLLLYGINTGED